MVTTLCFGDLNDEFTKETNTLLEIIPNNTRYRCKTCYRNLRKFLDCKGAAYKARQVNTRCILCKQSLCKNCFHKCEAFDKNK